MFDNRVSLRKKRSATKSVAFFGNPEQEMSFETAVFTQAPFTRGISRGDARAMFNVNITQNVEVITKMTPTRREQLTALSMHFKKIDVFTSLSTDEYASEMLSRKAVFQPHGVGLRHAIYEAMMLGVPSIIPECSYLNATTREHNVIIPEIVTAKDSIRALDDIDKINCEAMIDAFEHSMTPESIVSNVLSQCH